MFLKLSLLMKICPALGCDSDWILQRTGILERRKAAPHQATSDLALLAAQNCLERADVSASDVDLILVASITPDHASPFDGLSSPAATGMHCAGYGHQRCLCWVHVRTRYRGAVRELRCIELCIGSWRGSHEPHHQSGRQKERIRCSAMELARCLLRPTKDLSKGLLSYTLGSEGCGGQMLCIPSGGSRQPLTAEALAAGDHYLRMEGRSVFKWAVRGGLGQHARLLGSRRTDCRSTRPADSASSERTHYRFSGV